MPENNESRIIKLSDLDAGSSRELLDAKLKALNSHTQKVVDFVGIVIYFRNQLNRVFDEPNMKDVFAEASLERAKLVAVLAAMDLVLGYRDSQSVLDELLDSTAKLTKRLPFDMSIMNE